MPTSPRPVRPRRRAWSLTTHALVIALAIVLAAVTLPGAALAATRGVVLLPSERGGDEVVVDPAALRAPQGTAEVDVTLGTEAPGDVVVVPRLLRPAVATDGTVTVGDAPAPGSVSPGSRLRPGETLRLTVTGIDAPTLVVVRVTAPDGTPAPGEPAALVLPGAVGDPPTATLARTDDTVEATVATTAPVLVAVTLAGGTTTTLADRLILPDAPVTVAVPAAGWPQPTEVAVTDELGRTVTATTGTTPLVVLAGLLLLGAVGVLWLLARRHRSPATAP